MNSIINIKRLLVPVPEHPIARHHPLINGNREIITPDEFGW